MAGDDDFVVSNILTLELFFTELFDNDVDPEGDPLELVTFTSPAHGQVRATNPAGMVYTPNIDYVGTDSFTYTVADSFGATSTATIDIDVKAAPVAAADVVTVTPGADAVVPYTQILSNDTGVDLFVDPAAFEHSGPRQHRDLLQRRPVPLRPGRRLPRSGLVHLRPPGLLRGTRHRHRDRRAG